MARRPQMPTGPIVSMAYQVRPEQREAMLSFLREAFVFYERAGGLRMGLYESVDEPGLFAEVVAYDSDKDYAADQARIAQAPEYQEMLGRWHKLIDGPLEVRRMKPIRLGSEDPVEFGPGGKELVERVWRDRWAGSPMITPAGTWSADQVESIAARSAGGRVRALITFVVQGDTADLVSVDAMESGHGRGARLLNHCEQVLAARGVRKLRLFTLEDNLEAVGFYQRQGYRVVGVHQNALEPVRRAKPEVKALVGEGGRPLRDVWELQKAL